MGRSVCLYVTLASRRQAGLHLVASDGPALRGYRGRGAHRPRLDWRQSSTGPACRALRGTRRTWSLCAFRHEGRSCSGAENAAAKRKEWVVRRFGPADRDLAKIVGQINCASMEIGEQFAQDSLNEFLADDRNITSPSILPWDRSRPSAPRIARTPSSVNPSNSGEAIVRRRAGTNSVFRHLNLYRTGTQSAYVNGEKQRREATRVSPCR